MSARHSIPTLFVVTGLLLGSVATAWGAQTKFSLEKLCQRAELIVVGEVLKLEYTTDLWPRVGTIAFTDVTLRVEETWKGKVESRELVVRIPGGENPDGSVLHVSETPRFKVGERVLVFCRTYLDRLWVYGWEQGKYRVVVKRVVGKPEFAIDKDVMTYTLRRRVEAILARADKTPATPRKPRGG